MKQPYPNYKSSGVEWLGDVPECWELKRLRRVATLKAGDGIPSDEILEEGKFPVFGGNGLRGYTDGFTHEGDFVLIGRQGALCGNVHLARGKFWASEHAVVAEPVGGESASWLMYLLDAMNLNQYSAAAAQPGLAIERIGALVIAVPSFGEQQGIVAFLDHETAQIDALIAKKQQLIERLAEYRTALITRTVTRGLPADAAEAAGLNPAPPLKASGVEWIGDVPEHWEVRRLGAALAQTVGGGTPSTDNEAYWAEEDEDGLPWVAIADMSAGGEVTTTAKRVTSLGLAAARLRPLPPGTIIYSMYASVGAVARLGGSAVTNQAILGLVPDQILESSFLYWWLTGIRKPVLALTRDNTQSNLNAETVCKIPVALPPTGEQRHIAVFLDRQTEAIDGLSARVEAAIERLQEYRTALITAAVTGKIDVRGREPAEPGARV